MSRWISGVHTDRVFLSSDFEPTYSFNVGGAALYMAAGRPNSSFIETLAPASVFQPRPPPKNANPTAGIMDPRQDLVDQIERAQRSSRARHRGSFSRRMVTSPAWAGIIPQPPRAVMPEGVRRTLQAAYADEYDPEEEAYAAGVAAGSVNPVASPAPGAPAPPPPASAPAPAHGAASALAAPAWLDDINWSTDDEGSFRYADDEAGSQEAAG